MFAGDYNTCTGQHDRLWPASAARSSKRSKKLGNLDVFGDVIVEAICFSDFLPTVSDGH